MPEISLDETARALIQHHIEECTKRYDLLYALLIDAKKENLTRIDAIESIMWKMMWSSIGGMASIVGILLELRHAL